MFISTFGGFILIFGKDSANEAKISTGLIFGNSGNSGNWGISILPKSICGNSTVDGKSGIGGPFLTCYPV